jgi:hypothetical protein
VAVLRVSMRHGGLSSSMAKDLQPSAAGVFRQILVQSIRQGLLSFCCPVRRERRVRAVVVNETKRTS